MTLTMALVSKMMEQASTSNSSLHAKQHLSAALSHP